jgi:acetyl-CoA carboxylase biotin carboxyl carrier protein
MIDLEFLRSLIAAVDQSGIDSLDISRAGTRIRIAKTPPAAPVMHAGGNSSPATVHAPVAGGVALPAPAAASAPASAAAPSASAGALPAAAAESNLVEIRSPMVGTFYRSPSPEAPAYVEVGTRVSKGQTLCILEAMKLMNELEAEIAGTIREILVDNAEPVEYGQALFRIEPNA